MSKQRFADLRVSSRHVQNSIDESARPILLSISNAQQDYSTDSKLREF